MSFDSRLGGAARIPGPQTLPVHSFRYRETSRLPLPARATHPDNAPPPAPAEVEMTRAELEALLSKTRAEAAAEAEARVVERERARTEAERARISTALERFAEEQKQYFGRVEGEVVRLALSVAGKILHREAQVDPMLVAALVQIALNQLKENTAVTLRVAPVVQERWRAHFASRPQSVALTVTGDGDLEPGDCVLETELGRANFSLSSQLKEVEQGFFDLLSQTPRD